MAKIIEFKTRTDEVLNFLDEVKKEVVKQNIDNIMFICKAPDGDVMTGFTKNVDIGLSIELISHAKVLTIRRIIREDIELI